MVRLPRKLFAGNDGLQSPLVRTLEWWSGRVLVSVRGRQVASMPTVWQFPLYFLLRR